MNELKQVLASVKDGTLSVEDALLKIKTQPFEDIGFAKVDLHRKFRQGAAEVIYGAGKTPAQMLGILRTMQAHGQKTVLIPRLREQMAAAPGGAPVPSLEPRDFAQSTCYRAGHLVTRNAGWRNLRPVLTPSLCTGCLQCYLYCPDGAVVRTHATKDQLSAGDSPAAAVALDYDFCKGCGICVRACRFDALTMIPEEEALAARQTADGEELAAAFLSDYEHEGGAR